MEDPRQVEYLEEIGDLRRRLRALEEAQGAPGLIAEYAIEVQLLESLLLAARELAEALIRNPELGEQLLVRGYDSRKFQDVYSFVYEVSMEIDLAGEQLARAVAETDFAQLLIRQDAISG
ncbi:MAG: hypothetical protein WBU92_03390 [Candidatus Dormiibacterota bacterium]